MPTINPPHFTNAFFDVVALAASAGGLTALTNVLSALPAEFPAAIAIVQHLDPRHRSLMADILSRHTALEVKQAEEGDCLASGVVYIAPPNRHLLVNGDGTLSLTQSELVHFLRPSAHYPIPINILEKVALLLVATALLIHSKCNQKEGERQILPFSANAE
jgi:two-component system, chemotaxis family, protein-glutamate methylesterase/glutaminase